jgi:hypothetical protein
MTTQTGVQCALKKHLHRAALRQKTKKKLQCALKKK